MSYHSRMKCQTFPYDQDKGGDKLTYITRCAPRCIEINLIVTPDASFDQSDAYMFSEAFSEAENKSRLMKQEAGTQVRI